MKWFSEFVLVLIIVVGCILSSLLGFGVYHYETKSIHLKFKSDVFEKIASIERELLVNLEVLYSLKGFWDNSDSISLSKFTRYSQALLNRHSGIHALEWAPKVMHANRDIFSTERPLEEGIFEITERHSQGGIIRADDRDVYFPVYYVEPLIGNELALGFDLASNSSRKKTLTKALNTGEPLATSSITLVQESNNEKGFLILIPIYNGLPTTVTSRQKNIKGFIVGVYRIGDIFRTAFKWSPTSGINAKLIDITNNSNELLYEKNTNSAVEQDYLNKLSYTKNLKPFNGRNWKVIATPTLEYIDSKHSYLPYLLAVSSMLLVLLIAYYTYLISIRNKALNEAQNNLEKLIETDALTAISNRRCFDKQIEIEWNRAIRDRSMLSLLMIDVDDFKSFNDLYGHVHGDICLKEVAAAMKKVINRSSDLIARYGGEEFVVILPSTEHAESIGELCRKAVEELKIPHKGSPTSEYITISVGITSIQPKIKSEAIELISIADKALYQAKESGRNKVIVLSYTDV